MFNFSPHGLPETIVHVRLELCAAWGEAYAKFAPKFNTYPALFLDALDPQADDGARRSLMEDFLATPPCSLDPRIAQARVRGLSDAEQLQAFTGLCAAWSTGQRAHAGRAQSQHLFAAYATRCRTYTETHARTHRAQRIKGRGGGAEHLAPLRQYVT